MDKIQINIPSQTLKKLKALSVAWERNTSEIIRIAIDRLLNQTMATSGDTHDRTSVFRTFSLGKVKASPEKISEILRNQDR